MQELKVEGLASFVDISFWHTLANEKLKTIKLDTKTIPLTAHIYPGIQNIPSRLHLNSNSFNALYSS